MKTIHTDKAPEAIGPYVQGKLVGNLLFASGQVPLSPETGQVVGETIQEQTEQVLKNIAAILTEAGTTANSTPCLSRPSSSSSC